MNPMIKCTTVVVRFRGDATIKEIYETKIKEVKDMIKILTSQEKLQEAKLYLMELLAEVDNAQWNAKGYGSGKSQWAKSPEEVYCCKKCEQWKKGTTSSVYEGNNYGGL